MRCANTSNLRHRGGVSQGKGALSYVYESTRPCLARFQTLFIKHQKCMQHDACTARPALSRRYFLLCTPAQPTYDTVLKLLRIYQPYGLCCCVIRGGRVRVVHKAARWHYKSSKAAVSATVLPVLLCPLSVYDIIRDTCPSCTCSFNRLYAYDTLVLPTLLYSYSSLQQHSILS